MNMGKLLATVALSTVMATGLAMAQGSGSGTPDSQGGAVGKDQPSSSVGAGASTGMTTSGTTMPKASMSGKASMSAGAMPKKAAMHRTMKHRHRTRHHTM